MKVAVVQTSTEIYNTPATLKKLQKMAEEAKKGGAELILFPEAFVGGYPDGVNYGKCIEWPDEIGRQEYEKYYKSAIEEHGPEAEFIERIAIRLGVHLVTGVIERAGSTLYCAVFFFSPTGYLGKHRKIMPTWGERLIWGQGDGSTMPVFDTPLGKMGAAICHENYMTPYRIHLYSKGIQLYLAPTMDDLENWHSLMRAIAMEGRCFVITTTQYMKSSAYPEGHRVRKELGNDHLFFQGGCCIIDPLGNYLIEPDRTGEVIRYADIDVSATIRGKCDLDTVGHYSRPDIFELHVNERPLPGVVHKK